MSTSHALPGDALLDAFPFHLWLDAQLRVVQVGPVLARLAPELQRDAPGLAAFRLLAPELDGLDADALRAAREQAIVLELGRTGMLLRGQRLALDDGAQVLLLEPWITDPQQLERWRLRVDDFPIHSVVPEQLALIRDLRASQHRTATHLRQMPLAVIDWDVHGRVEAWNPAAAKIFGVPTAQAIGRGIEVLQIVRVLEGATPRPDGQVDLLAELGHRVVVEHRTTSGATVLCGWHNTRLEDLDGQPIGVSSILRDVTESVRTERALRETQKLESLGLLAGGVAHDFNNLLAAVIGNADLAQMQTEPDTAVAAHLREITAIAERATALTKRLLDYAGQASYELEPLSLAELVERMRPTLSAELDERIRLRVRAPAQLPAINADLGQLRQVLLGLVVNAAEAIGERGGEIQISTELVSLSERLDGPGIRGGPLEPGSYVRVVVTDDGAGMSAELLSRVFDPFFSTKFTGRGLGLAAILGIVRGHRGAIRIESEPGVGTRVELLFPTLEPVAEAPAAEPRPEPRSGKGRLLVVDDEAQIRRVLTVALAGAGFDVVAAEAGNTALELYDSDPQGFDLVLTDLTMPGLDGHELFAALTARDPRLPVILSSGYSEHQGVSCYPDGTPATFLKKPYRLGYLLEKVNEELERRSV